MARRRKGRGRKRPGPKSSDLGPAVFEAGWQGMDYFFPQHATGADSLGLNAAPGAPGSLQHHAEMATPDDYQPRGEGLGEEIGPEARGGSGAGAGGLATGRLGQGGSRNLTGPSGIAEIEIRGRIKDVTAASGAYPQLPEIESLPVVPDDPGRGNPGTSGEK